jgi:hypothetical protein
MTGRGGNGNTGSCSTGTREARAWDPFLNRLEGSGVGRMGMIRGSEGAVMVSMGEADSADSWTLSKGLLPSMLELGVAIWGLEFTGALSKDDRELDEDEDVVVGGICGRLEAPDPFSFPPLLVSFNVSFLPVAETPPVT